MAQPVQVGLIGTGNMGGAILHGLLNSKLVRDGKIAVSAYNRTPEKAAALGVPVHISAQALTAACKIVILAVKPQGMEELLEEISSSVTADTVLVSVAAGLSGEYFVRKTRPDARVILAMPNTPLLVGEGATALAIGSRTVGEDEFQLVCDIFAASGRIAVLPSGKMREIIAVSGSSPAFLYVFAKEILSYAEEAGVDADAARSLFAQTLRGVAGMLEKSELPPEELIRQVASPGGTTLAGLKALEDGGFSQAVRNACEACTKRAWELFQ